MLRTIKNRYNWENFEGMASSWRGDCLLGPLRQHIYKQILGYNDKTPHLSDLIRDGQISREEALSRISPEENSNLNIIKKCCTALNINYKTLEKAIRRAQISYETECKKSK